MAGVFISYRRDDTAGYAGRLFDDLVRTHGDAAVFMDVIDIVPGSDFVETIDRAVDACDVLLVLMGRTWLTTVDGQGRNRLEDQNDFIRHEVVAALERRIPVVPVLVQGARMPTADQLPDNLKALARRQAIELSDSRWDADVARLEAVIAPAGGGAARPAPGPPLHVPSQPRRFVPRVAILGLAAGVVIGAFAHWVSSGRNDGPRREPIEAGRDMDRANRNGTDQGANGTPSLIANRSSGASAYALHLPAASTARVNRQEFRILAARLETRDRGSDDLLSFLVRMTDHGGAGDNFWDDSFRLVLADGRRMPVSGLNQLLGPFAAQDGEVRFEVPQGVSKVELQISEGEDTRRLPVDLLDRTAIPRDGSADRFGLRSKPLSPNALARLPVALANGDEATFEGVTYKVQSASIERYDTETAAVSVTLRCTSTRPSAGVNLWDRNIRMVVDGVPRAPDESVNEVVPPETSKDATFVFLLRQRPDTLALRIRLERIVDIPLDVSRLR